MIRLERTNSQNPDFIALVALLDADLAQRDGADHAFYNQFNSIQDLRYALVAYDKEIAVGCGVIKPFDPTTVEVKRMYVLPDQRGKQIATHILNDLEIWASALNYKRCILETGKRQPEAIALYQKNGYTIIPNYGQYQGIENSVCFEKIIQYTGS